MTTKKTILIIIGALITIGIIAFAFIPLKNPELLNNCGDGICEAKEKANPKLCLRDCNISSQIETCGPNDKGYGINFREKCKMDHEGIGPDNCKAGRSAECCTPVEKQDSFSTKNSSELSYSFGVHPSSMDDYAYAKDLGIDFNREGNYFIWNWVDINKNGNFKFKGATAPPHPDKPNSGGTINYDKEQERLSKVANITVMRNVCPFRGGSALKDEFRNTEEQEIYQEFVKKLVERYDGDSDLGCTQNAPDCYNIGDGEYPSQSFINTMQANPIKYWQVCNQVTDTCSGRECKDNNSYAIKYAKVQELTYLGVKTSCPECQVLIAGDSHKEMYPPVYEALGGKYVDIIDKHFFGEADDYTNIQDEMAYLKDSLQNNGFNLDELNFWITETGTYSGDPIEDKGMIEKGLLPLPHQSETQQAQGLVKRYTVAFGEGIEKVLWAWGIIEGFGCDCCIFDYTGLIYDGNREPQICDINDPYDCGDGVKKLAYYSFKFMIDKIGGFANIETVQDSGNYVYKFTKNNKPVYVAWNDNGGSITLTGIDSDSVKITEAIPNAESGADLNANDYLNFFKTEIKSISNGQITITLGENPVFIEEHQYKA
uniref:Uncharacterized protein n=1 Tax=Uncultured archaeon GZfos26G2 TaxID=3386331 RepID=Q64C46_UNCAG|nr:hypothetical protein GZ26D6_7 [uncultured archaeon GZfos26D6]